MRTDAELVRAVLDGEKQVFAKLVKRYERPVRAVALDVLGDYHLAADISQETFVKAYEHLATLRRPEAFGPWLMKIARRNALESAQYKPKANRLETDIASATESPDGRLDEEKQRLLEAVVNLPRAEQQVVMLHYLGEKKPLKMPVKRLFAKIFKIFKKNRNFSDSLASIYKGNGIPKS